MDASLLRAVRWLIVKESHPATIAVRPPIRHPTLAVFRAIMARPQFLPTALDGVPWVTGRGASVQRSIDFIRSTGEDISPSTVGARRRVWRRSISAPWRLYRFSRQMNRRYGAQIAVRSTVLVAEIENARLLLAEARPSFLLVNNDYSETSLALAVACERVGVPIILSQTSEINHREAAHRAAVGIVYPSHNPFAGMAEHTVVRPYDTPVRPLRLPIPENPRVGIALTNYAAPDDVSMVVEELRRKLRPSRIVIRPHPNGTVSFGPDQSDPTESLEQFFNRCDLLLVGNSSIQMQAIRAGLPVAHCGGLDKLPFDAAGLVSNGSVYGAPTVSEISINGVDRFYASRSSCSGEATIRRCDNQKLATLIRSGFAPARRVR